MPVEYKVQRKIIVCVFGVNEFLTQEIIKEEKLLTGWRNGSRRKDNLSRERLWIGEILIEFLTQEIDWIYRVNNASNNFCVKEFITQYIYLKYSQKIIFVYNYFKSF